MLKVHVDDEGNPSNVEVRGSVMRIAADVAAVIRTMHGAMSEDDPSAAKDFRDMLTILAVDSSSPMWRENDGE